MVLAIVPSLSSGLSSLKEAVERLPTKANAIKRINKLNDEVVSLKEELDTLDTKQNTLVVESIKLIDRAEIHKIIRDVLQSNPKKNSKELKNNKVQWDSLIERFNIIKEEEKPIVEDTRILKTKLKCARQQIRDLMDNFDLWSEGIHLD